MASARTSRSTRKRGFMRPAGLLVLASWIVWPVDAAPPSAAPSPDAAAAAEAEPPASAAPAGKQHLFRDPTDGAFDMSNWLLEHHGFLPVPIVITDPALGYGGGLMATFFHRPESAPATRTGADGQPQLIPPNMYGIGGMKTENGSKAYAAGAIMHFKEDTWRYLGGVADTDLNIDFYTSGRLLPERKIAVNMQGVMSLQQLRRRIGQSELFVAGQWIYMDLDPRLENASDRQYLKKLDFEQVSSGLGVQLEYDSRDNSFTPSRGYLFNAEGNFYMPFIGSDVEFQSYRVHGYGYWPLGKQFVLAGRADLRHVEGDVPFYRLPYIDMRGVPSARYQDDNTGVLEAELRWNVTPRWAGIGFAGAGRAWGDRASFSDASTAVSKGVGVRYLIARKLGIYMGLDYAWGPEDQTVIVQMGSAWR